VRVNTRAELIAAVAYGVERRLPIFVLGNGSNILVSDAGIRGLVIENHADAVQEQIVRVGDIGPEQLHVTAESGASLPGLANRLARRGWSGLEWAIGVPATVGAAVVTNAGAHGGAISDGLLSAELLDRQGEIRRLTNAELEFRYRGSLLKQPENEYVVLDAEFALTRAEPAQCVARMNQYSEHRRRTQPTEPSVGSMFKNPPGDYAGRVIEAAGLKGVGIGQVQVSRVHANFFVNRGGAAAKDVMQLVLLVRTRVFELYGIVLELEIQPVGAW